MRGKKSGPPVAELEPIIIRRVAAEATRRGVDVGAIIGGLGFSLADLQQPALLVSSEQTQLVVRRAMDVLKDKHLGLSLGATANPTSWGDCLLGLMASADTHQMLSFFAEFFPSTGPMLHLHCDETAQGRWLVATSPSDDSAFTAFLVEKTFAGLSRACRCLVGPGFRPLQVELAMPPAGQSGAHAGIVGCPVRFATVENRMLFPRVPLPLESADPVVAERVRQRLRQQAQGVPRMTALEAMVSQMLRNRLDKPPTLAEVAASLNIGERTLRRRLEALGLNYAALLDRERKARALPMLRGQRTPLAEVAAASGFVDTRSLRRAVKRWSGTSPSKIRSRG